MSKKLSRRDFLKLSAVTAILTGCGPLGRRILATVTSLPPEFTPTSTSTPVPPTLTPTPTVEDIKMNGTVQKAIEKLVMEFNKNGIPITREELLQNGLKVIRINGVDENDMAKIYNVIVTVAASQSEEGGGYPVAMIDSENNSIQKIDINVILGMIGIDYCPFAENKMTFFNFLPVECKRQRINQAIPECAFVKLSAA